LKSTINDVARMANVSKATVSRVLNGHLHVSEEVKNRVYKAMEELNYRPSGVARSLVSKKTQMAGLILPDITNPFFPLLARGVEDAANRYGYSVFQCNTDNDPDIEFAYIDKLLEQRVDGIILISSNLDDKRIRRLTEYNIPFVLCDRFAPSTSFDSVSVDHYKVAYDAVNYLISKNYRCIAHISGPLNVESADRRRLGYLQAMAEAGLTPLVKHGSFSYQSGYQLTQALLSEIIPEAIFAANDLIALGAIRAIEENGLVVPKDISIIGCDDIFIADIYKPRLTTVMIPAYQMGIKAMEILQQRIAGEIDLPQKVILEHRLVIRDS